MTKKICKCHCYTNFNNYKDTCLFEIEDFLTPEECDGIIDYLKSQEDDFFPSKIWREGKDVLDLEGRICKQKWCKVDEHVLFRKIKYQARKFFGALKDEDLLALRYNAGGFFRAHFDAGEGQCDLSETNIGHRKWTIITYLNDDYDGGSTFFPLLNKTIFPKKGKALCFRNIDDNLKVIKEAQHCGQPVSNGKKYIINQWLYHEDF